MKPIKKNRFFVVLALTVTACISVCLALPHDPYVRYQRFDQTIFSKLTWIYERIHATDEPIDIVFLGSSRTGRGANSELVEAYLNDSGVGLHAVNFSLPAAGLDVRSTILHEILSRKKIKLVVYGVVETLPRGGHQAYGDLAPVNEILRAPFFVNQNLPGNYARLPYRQMELAAMSLSPSTFGYAGAESLGEVRPPKHNLPVGTLDGGDAIQIEGVPGDTQTELLLREAKRRKRELTPPILPDSMGFIEFGVSQHYVRELSELSTTHGFKLAFVFFPFYGGLQEPTDLAYLEQFGPVWRANFLMHDPENYRDAAHCSESGAILASKWLAAQIQLFMDNDQ